MYANADPVNNIDPSGYIANLSSFGSALSGFASLGAASTSLGGYIYKRLAVKMLSTGIGTLSGTVIYTILKNLSQNDASLVSERARTHARVERKARGRNVVFHYTTRLKALLISASGLIFATDYRGPTADGFPRPYGAYASSIPPWSSNFTMREFAINHFASPYRAERGLLGWFVAVDRKDFFPVYGPNFEWVRPALRGQLAVPVDVITIGPSLLLP